MKNYYRLTKKELSIISSIQMPIVGYDNKCLSKPAVVVTFIPTNRVAVVYSLKRFRRMVNQGQISTEFYKYEILSMY